VNLVDLVNAVVARTLRSLIGVPEGDSAEDLRWSTATAIDLLAPGVVSSATALMAMRRARRAVVGAWSTAPDQSFLGDLRAGASESALGEEELVEVATSVLVAGLVTTVQTACQGFLAVAERSVEHSDEAVLASGAASASVDRTVEEMLRLVSFGTGFVRTTPSGSRHFVALAAANRDGSVFPNPEHFAPSENRAPSLTFGFGAHRCLGAAVARVILGELVGVLFPRLRTVDGAVSTWRMSPVLRLLEQLPVELR
jgi:cytochrome P450